LHPDNDNRAIHYPADASSLEGGWLSFYLARGVTVLFGILLIICVYGLARQAVPGQKQVAITAALLVAIIPQVAFLSGLVSNDIPAAAISTATLWLLVAFMRRGWSKLLALGIGLSFGLAVLLKVSALTLALPISLGLLWMTIYRRQSWRDVFIAGALVLFGSLLTASWWFIRSWYLFGSPLGLETHDQAPWAIDDPTQLGEPRFRWIEVFRSFWIWLGWGTIRPRDEYYYILFIFAILACVGLAIAVIRRRRAPRPRPDATLAVFLILISALLTTVVFLEVWMRRVTAPYGRLMYPVIGVIILLLVIGWRAIHPKFPIIPITVLLITAILAPFLLLKPAYAMPQFLTEKEIAEKSSISWFFGEKPEDPIIELLSVTPLEQTIYPDSLLPVELCWRAVSQVNEDYTMLVHIIGPENALIANRRTYPGLGSYPTSIWQPDTAWCDLIHIMVADQGVPRTLVYKIEIGVLTPELDDRLEVFNAAGEQIGAPFAAEVLIVQEDGGTEHLGDDIEGLSLVDFQISPVWKLDQENQFTLTWTVSAPLMDDLQLFVHLRDGETGETIAQADGPPIEGWYPTSRWLPGTAIKDERKFHVPANVTPGEFDLIVGFYDLATGQPFGHEYFISAIEVQP
jgi:hypothetical protein